MLRGADVQAWSDDADNGLLKDFLIPQSMRVDIHRELSGENAVFWKEQMRISSRLW